MNVLKSLTLNGKTYDSFNDKEAVKLINNMKPDENGNINIGGGVSSWNDLTDKPFFDEGNKTATLDFANLPDVTVPTGDLTFYKVTDDILTESMLKGSKVTATITDNAGLEKTETLTIIGFTAGQEFEFGRLFADMIAENFIFFIVVVDKAGEFTVDGSKVKIAETGTYFTLMSNQGETPNLMSLEYDYAKQLDAKFIPDEIYTEIDQKIENYINEALGGDY